jgi:hypothetical protein
MPMPTPKSAANAIAETAMTGAAALGLIRTSINDRRMALLRYYIRAPWLFLLRNASLDVI